MRNLAARTDLVPKKIFDIETSKADAAPHSADENAPAQTNSNARETLGAQLRQARESKGVSLREIADETRISRRYLEAIESDNYQLLPGGIFNRSFIKSYARHIGFDENRALEAYERTAREQGVAHGEPSVKPHKPVVYGGGSPQGRTVLLSVIVLAIICAAIYFALQWSRRPQTSNSAVANKNAASSPTPSAPTNAPPNSNAAANSGAPLKITLKARGEDVWISSRTDDGKPAEEILKAEQSKDFSPQQSFVVQYPKIKAHALEVTVNNRPVKTPDTSVKPNANKAELQITKDSYQQLAQ